MKNDTLWRLYGWKWVWESNDSWRIEIKQGLSFWRILQLRIDTLSFLFIVYLLKDLNIFSAKVRWCLSLSPGKVWAFPFFFLTLLDFYFVTIFLFSHFQIGPFKVPHAGKAKIKVRVNLSLHGIVTIESASVGINLICISLKYIILLGALEDEFPIFSICCTLLAADGG